MRTRLEKKIYHKLGLNDVIEKKSNFTKKSRTRNLKSKV